MKIPDSVELIKVNKRVIKYVFSGIMAFATEYVSFIILFYFFHFHLTIANVISFFAGFTVSFLLNRNWVFGDVSKNGDRTRQLLKYFILALINVVISSILINLFSIFIVVFLSKLITVCTIAVWNYFIYKKFIFK